MNLYKFDQNNSGGSFVVDDVLTHRVIIEALTEKDAISKAEDLGIYFNGVDEGIDCPCCGDRWDEPYRLDFPLQWNKETVFNCADTYLQHLTDKFGREGVDIRVFMNNGDIKEFTK